MAITLTNIILFSYLDDDNTALIKACHRGYVKRVRELLEKGTKFNVDYTDKVPIV